VSEPRIFDDQTLENFRQVGCEILRENFDQAIDLLLSLDQNIYDLYDLGIVGRGYVAKKLGIDGGTFFDQLRERRIARKS